jgi:hypothetical protein
MHPYRSFPDRQFWNRAVSPKPWGEIFLDQPAKFRLGPRDRIASAGSCFARRIAEHLLTVGYNYELYEPCPEIIAPKAEEYGYGAFSCRYGNIYTTRQLRQLLDEALGLRSAIFRFAELAPGKVIDLMRPNINGTGFGSVEEARVDRLHHLTRVRRMIEEMEVFVFTLGLTEAWADERADIVYGSHPGVFVNDLRAEHLVPVNIEYAEVVRDFEYVLELIARHNRHGARVILTVSPVGLAATHQDQHVITATTYSKSVLRAAAGKLASSHAHVDYFPSYEIFSLSQSFGQFLADDLREVNARGVGVAMGIFETMFLEPGASPERAMAGVSRPASAPIEADNPADAECDEVANAYFGDRG